MNPMLRLLTYPFQTDEETDWWNDKKKSAPSGMGSMDDIKQINDPSGQIRFTGPGINIRVGDQSALDRIRSQAGRMVGLPPQTTGSFNVMPGPVEPDMPTERRNLIQGVADSLDTSNRRAYNPANAASLSQALGNFDQGALNARQWNEGAAGRQSAIDYNTARGQADITEAEAKLQREKNARAFVDMGLDAGGRPVGGLTNADVNAAKQRSVLQSQIINLKAQLGSADEGRRKGILDGIAALQDEISKLDARSGKPADDTEEPGAWASRWTKKTPPGAGN